MLVGFLSVLTGTPRKHPIEFEENSLNMTAKELLYFAFKYYVKNVSNGNKFGYLKLPAGYKSYHPSIPSELKLHIGGDLMPYKLIQEKHCEQFWLERKDFFKADIVAANLETPYSIGCLSLSTLIDSVTKMGRFRACSNIEASLLVGGLAVILVVCRS